MTTEVAVIKQNQAALAEIGKAALANPALAGLVTLALNQGMLRAGFWNPSGDPKDIITVHHLSWGIDAEGIHLGDKDETMTVQEAGSVKARDIEGLISIVLMLQAASSFLSASGPSLSALVKAFGAIPK